MVNNQAKRLDIQISERDMGWLRAEISSMLMDIEKVRKVAEQHGFGDKIPEVFPVAGNLQETIKAWQEVYKAKKRADEVKALLVALRAL